MGKRTFLFQAGDQCVDVTGGWEFFGKYDGDYKDDVNHEWTNGSIYESCIRLFASSEISYNDGEYDRTVSWSCATTSRPVDLTNVDYITTTTTEGSSYVSGHYCNIYITKNKGELITTYETSGNIDTLDVSEYTGEYYVCFYIFSQTGGEQEEGYYEESSVDRRFGCVYMYDRDSKEDLPEGASVPGYIGISNMAQPLLGGYIGIDNKARKLVKAYYGDVNGIAKMVWNPRPEGVLWYYDGAYYNELKAVDGFHKTSGWQSGERPDDDDDDYVSYLDSAATDDIGYYEEKIIEIRLDPNQWESRGEMYSSFRPIDFTDIQSIEIEYVSPRYREWNYCYFELGSSDKTTVEDGMVVGYNRLVHIDLNRSLDHTICKSFLDCSTVSGEAYLRFSVDTEGAARMFISKIIAHYK